MTNEQALLMQASALVNKLLLIGNEDEPVGEEARDWLSRYSVALQERQEAEAARRRLIASRGGM